MTATLKDDRDEVIRLNDRVMVTYIDASRGAELWMSTGYVTGFGRTRVKVRFTDGRTASVGAECLRVIEKIGA